MLMKEIIFHSKLQSQRVSCWETCQIARTIPENYQTFTITTGYPLAIQTWLFKIAYLFG